MLKKCNRIYSLRPIIGPNIVLTFIPKSLRLPVFRRQSYQHLGSRSEYLTNVPSKSEVVQEMTEIIPPLSDHSLLHDIHNPHCLKLIANPLRIRRPEKDTLEKSRTE
jgi:hypothetical protein